MAKPARKQRSRAATIPSTAASRVAASADAELAELDSVFESVARYFAILSEATRLKILHAICLDERSVGDIVHATGATQTNVSRHLALMREAGVVARRRVGTTVYYRLIDPDLAQLCRSACVRIAGRIEAGEPLRRELLDFAAQP